METVHEQQSHHALHANLDVDYVISYRFANAGKGRGSWRTTSRPCVKSLMEDFL